MSTVTVLLTSSASFASSFIYLSPAVADTDLVRLRSIGMFIIGSCLDPCFTTRSRLSLSGAKWSAAELSGAWWSEVRSLLTIFRGMSYPIDWSSIDDDDEEEEDDEESDESFYASSSCTLFSF